ncbi:MAG: type II toxin-antitoxin system PemK/MazF family toxin [Pirellulales bacterium]|nr:type II toxin-antitoxin system PemK/MazF family toxin [Pirellulales bacterium]
MVIERGEIWWATLSEPRGSQPGYSRPVLIVQSDDFNRSRIGTVIAVVITSNTRLAEAPGNVLLSKKSSGLPKESVANVSQLITLDKAFLAKKVRKLAKRELAAVEAGLQLILSLQR